ncbi:MAG: hypothetical protein VYD19_01435, partial [Myxococcota bacterium]|nr:hypothetical protein [Myxococcota bacterium]
KGRTRPRTGERQSDQKDDAPLDLPEPAQSISEAEGVSSSDQAVEREEDVEVSTHTSTQKLGLDGARISPPEAPPPVSRSKPPLSQRRFRLIEETEEEDLRAPMLVRPTLDERFVDLQPSQGYNEQLSHALEAAQVMHIESMSDARLDRPIVRAPLFLGTLWSGADRFNALIDTLEPLILIQDNIDRERSEFFSFFGEDLASRRLSREELDGWWMSFHRLSDPRPLPAPSMPIELEADGQMRRERVQRLDRIEAASARQRALQSRYEAPQTTNVAQRPAPASRINAHTPTGFDARPLHDGSQHQPNAEPALARELSALAELPESGGNLGLVEADAKAKAEAEAKALREQSETGEGEIDLGASAPDSPEVLSALLATAEPLALRFDPSSLQRAVAERERVQRDRRVARKRKGRDEVKHRAGLSAQLQEAEVETISQPFGDTRKGLSLIKVNE